MAFFLKIKFIKFHVLIKTDLIIPLTFYQRIPLFN